MTQPSSSLATKEFADSTVNQGNTIGQVAIETAQETLYNYFLTLIQKSPPEQALVAFKKLFFEFCPFGDNGTALLALEKLVTARQKSIFKQTLNRCCYILVNNLEQSRNYVCIRELIDSFSRSYPFNSSFYITPYLKIWIREFTQTSDYRKLKALVKQRHQSQEVHWSQRYTSYLLLSQALNQDNSKEQQEAAQILSEDLRKHFKYDLARYTASLKEQSSPQDSLNDNLKGSVPLSLEEVKLLRKLITKRGFFDYSNIANIFLKQTTDITYQNFKVALIRYLTFSVDNPKLAYQIKKYLKATLTTMAVEHNLEIINQALFVRTCNQILESLTTEAQEYPSPTLTRFMLWGDAYNYALLLVKIILICPYSRSFLDRQIAILVKYYQTHPEEECPWIMSFFAILTIAISVQVDQDVRYSLVKTESRSQGNTVQYRIFSQQSS